MAVRNCLLRGPCSVALLGSPARSSSRQIVPMALCRRHDEPRATSMDSSDAQLKLLSSAVQHSLRHNFYENAIFLAEKLRSLAPLSSQATYLLAQTYYQDGQLLAAYRQLRSHLDVTVSAESSTWSCRYLLAKCCYDLGKYDEGADLLANIVETDESASIDIHDFSIDMCFCLYGQLARKQLQNDIALKYFTKALKLNPFLWTAFESLAEIGFEPQLFKIHKGLDESISAEYLKSEYFQSQVALQACWKSEESQRSHCIAEELGTEIHRETADPVAQHRRTTGEKGAVKKSQAPVPTQSLPRPLTRSLSRQSAASSSLVNEREKKRPRSTVAQRDNDPTEPSHPDNRSILYQQAAEEFMGILAHMSTGYYKLARYRCNEAVECFRSISPQIQASGWLQCQIGRAFYESGNFKEADAVFRQVRENEPWRMTCMDIYSTSLWQLKKTAELSYLAHDLVSVDRKAPEAWIAVANCFSLKSEHEMAYRALQRAIQLDPSYPYTYTLMGHEYYSDGDYERSVQFYEKALSLEKSCYSAWVGLGCIAIQQENPQNARYHFERALRINPFNPEINTHLALAHEKSGNMAEALKYLKRADSCEPKIATTAFRRARILYGQGKYSEALAELEESVRNVPNECNTRFLMGKIYKKLGEPRKALMSFTSAQTYGNSKSSSIIKDAIERVKMDDELSPGELGL
ncbi:uncharacterized protein BJ171DRAFT_524381 [Polychytrium aggregatum]|uniref:uncharacterized protein n=1 Tax=Polychytrium aggregatum TaxID=110093 RepID=UPI0022FE0DCF|nr:uncharacterized protein BJ171DRAFT_524381 [Polychytrium aggregatum]KAI9193741.1 hypothetical protein BJ171DRAFT_524381 [Polychytrium aggregatum]